MQLGAFCDILQFLFAILLFLIRKNNLEDTSKVQCQAYSAFQGKT